MKDYQPWDASWKDDIIEILLLKQINKPVEMPMLFGYPVFLKALNDGVKGEELWKAIAGTMIYIMGHQPDNNKISSYVYWIKHYNPSIYRELVYDGVNQILKGKFEKPIWLFQAALIIEPQKTEVHYNLGLAFYHMGLELIVNDKKQEGRSCWRQAIRYFKNVLEIDTKLSLAQYYLECIYKEIEN
ncbi:MAG: hypothetical protein PHI90_05295 [Clostridia bacterium]|nr:hypothetical protein [Clostridia bacterium]MDD4048229.1 hypothetical protein [Clostridia bacterium]